MTGLGDSGLAMPVIEGAEAFTQIRPLAPSLPIVLTSGYDVAGSK
jgi:hypothetical protein